VKSGLELVPVSRMDEVLRRALLRMPVPIVWEEDEKSKAAPVIADDDGAAMVAH
jgi:ATP-dependent Lon protease